MLCTLHRMDVADLSVWIKFDPMIDVNDLSLCFWIGKYLGNPQ